MGDHAGRPGAALFISLLFLFLFCFLALTRAPPNDRKKTNAWQQRKGKEKNGKSAKCGKVEAADGRPGGLKGGSGPAAEAEARDELRCAEPGAGQLRVRGG